MNNIFRSVIAVAFLLAMALSDAWAASDSRLTAVWFDPSRNGEGWVVERLTGTTATVTWFTFDENGHQRWLLGVADVSSSGGETVLHVEQLYVTSGGRFGSAFDPSQVSQTDIGDLSVRFNSCGSGALSYNAFGQTGQASLVRLSETMANGCAARGKPGDVVDAALAGQTGSWFDPTHTGEGFQLQWTTGGEALITWYSYDHHGNQRWMIGAGAPDGATIRFPTLYTASGARFGEAFDPDDVDLVEWGSMNLVLDCQGGTASFDTLLHDDFEDGVLNVVPLTRAAGPCPAELPQLRELFLVELQPLDVEDLPFLRITDVSDDGALVGLYSIGSAAFELATRAPGGEWQRHPGAVLMYDGALRNPVGDVVAPPRLPPDPAVDVQPFQWSSGQGWRPVQGFSLHRSDLLGASTDGGALVGVAGSPIPKPWRWTAAGGQQELQTGAISLPRPNAVSADGSIVVGYSRSPTAPGQVLEAVLWDGNSAPIRLVDGEYPLGAALACDESCSAIFGSGSSAAHPYPGQAWVRAQGRISYLGEVPDAIPGAGARYAPVAASKDGSVVAGNYYRVSGSGEAHSQAFVWTPLSGMVSVRHLLEQEGLGHLLWDDVQVMDISPDGTRIALKGYNNKPYGNSENKGAILVLTPLSAPK